MTTAYSYDIRNRMTKIEYKDGEAVLDGFTYTLSAGSNIVTTAHADGAEWTYEYDGRHRLTKAERDNDGDTITATYEYTYDDGDSLITKVEPFSDDFNDTNYTGWTVGAGTWSASSGAMRNTVTSESWSYFSRSQSDADHDLQFTYVCNDDSDSGYTLRVEARFTGWSDDRLCLYVEPDRMILKEMVNGGSWTWLSTNTSADTDEGTEYNVRMECDDDDITVWRGEVGGGMSQVLSTSSATVTSTNSIYFDVSPDADYSIDNIRLIADDLTTTTTFAYDDANELTSMTNNGTVNFTYDDWGRMISKYQGDFDASYAYRYGDKLYSITSDFNGEGTVTYQYGADGKRRQRTANSVTTKYRWDAGWNMINEENVLDVLTMTYVANGGVLAELTGTVPSSGTARYYCHDNLGSTRRLRAADRSSAGEYEFTPYGTPYAESGIALSALGGAFTGRSWEGAFPLWYFPHRFHAPETARWMTRDPLGMIDRFNLYGYALQNPVAIVDPLGLDSVAIGIGGLFGIGGLITGYGIGCRRTAGQELEFFYDKYMQTGLDGSDLARWEGWMRHCSASCMIRSREGWLCAKLAEEWYEHWSHPDRGESLRDDLNANAAGRALGKCCHTRACCEEACLKRNPWGTTRPEDERYRSSQ